MSIIRVAKRKPGFTVVDNQAIEDMSLSWEALGLFVYLTGQAGEFSEITLSNLPARTVSERKLSRMLKELEDAGYLKREHEREVTHEH